MYALMIFDMNPCPNALSGDLRFENTFQTLNLQRLMMFDFVCLFFLIATLFIIVLDLSIASWEYRHRSWLDESMPSALTNLLVTMSKTHASMI